MTRRCGGAQGLAGAPRAPKRRGQAEVPLPEGFRLSLDPGARRIDGGRVLVGGFPLRLLRLTPQGAALVDRLVEGEPLPPSPGARRLARRLVSAGLAHPQPPPPGSGLSPSQVAVVVPVRDRPVGLRRTLESLGRVGEVVVVDDASERPVDLPAMPVPVRVLRNDRCLGPGAARNRGWRAVTRPVVAFLDADCEPSPGWLPPLLAHLADPLVAAAAPRVVSGPSVRSRLLGAYEATRSPLDLGALPAPVRPRSRVAYVPAAALVVRRSALEETGGFSEDLRVGEDVDFVWRLWEAGLSVRYEPAATVTHPARPDLRAFVRQRFAYGSSAAALALRHPGAAPPVAVSAFSAAAWGLVALGQPGMAVALAGATAVALVPRLSAIARPWREAVRLAGLGHLLAGRELARAVRRAWWPLGAVGAAASPRLRRVLLGAFALPPLLEWARRRPSLGPATWVVLGALDDLAYGAGVWNGCARERTLAPLVPDLSSWPGRRPAVEDAAAGLVAEGPLPARRRTNPPPHPTAGPGRRP